MQKSLDASICSKEVNIPVRYSGVQWEQPRRPDQQGLWQAGYRAGQGGHFPDKLTNTQTDRQTDNKQKARQGGHTREHLLSRGRALTNHFQWHWQCVCSGCHKEVLEPGDMRRDRRECSRRGRVHHTGNMCSVQPNMGKLDQFKPTREDVYIIQVQYLCNQVIMCKQVQYVQTGTICVI